MTKKMSGEKPGFSGSIDLKFSWKLPPNFPSASHIIL